METEIGLTVKREVMTVEREDRGDDSEEGGYESEGVMTVKR